jgi:hypothetical protein
MLWSEALYLPDPKQTIDHSQRKENRNEIENRYFHGYGDTFIADGGKDRHFGSIWWAAGRYIEVVVETAEEPLTIQSIGFTDTGYPYDFDASFESSEPLLAQIMPRGLHTLKMCSHETSMDCPHFEQLNYAGDTRLQSLVAMHCTADDRLVRKGIRLFDWSRSGDNWTASRYPTRTLQTIPPFALWWVGSVLDYARSRGDRAFLSQIMPGVRGVMERWRQQINDEGLVVLPAGWNFVDWIPGWPGGTRNEIGSPGGVEQWQVAYGLNALAQLEEMMGEPLLAQRNRQTAAALAATAERVYFDKARGMLADNLDHSKFSEHTQVMALVSGQLSSNLRESASKVLTTKSDLKTSSIYFSHYTFEALREIGRIDTLIERLAPWFDHAKNGLYTLIEQNEPTRSDCHAWGAHPIYHFFATILGVRPTAFGFEKVEIRPQLGPLTLARGEMFHPRGRIRVDLQQKQGRIGGEIALPEGLTGTLIANGQPVALKGGKQTVG